MTPTVSVIIPSYNRADYIGATLDSVLAQTFTDYEIIVVDDGSTDNTEAALDAYAGKIRYVYQENGGTASARNHGMRLAEGDYIAFLDSDDLWLPTKLEKQVALHRANPAIGLSHTDYIVFDSSGATIEDHKLQDFAGHIYEKLLFGCPIDTSTVMMPTQFVRGIGEFDSELNTMEDLDLWMRAAHIAPIGHIAETLTEFRQHDGNKSRSPIKLLPEQRYMSQKHRKIAPEVKTQVWRQADAHHIFIYGHTLLNSEPGQERVVWGWTLEGLRLWPFSKRGWHLGMRLLSRTLLPTPLKNRVRDLLIRER